MFDGKNPIGFGAMEVMADMIKKNDDPCERPNWLRKQAGKVAQAVTNKPQREPEFSPCESYSYAR